MDFQQAKMSNIFNKKEPPSRSEPDSAQLFPDLYLSRPEKCLFSGGEIREALFTIHEKTGAGSLENAMQTIWFKPMSKDEKAQVERVVSVLRLSQDGRITPPFDLFKAYRSIARAGQDLDPSGPSR